MIKNRVLDIVRAFREKGIINDNELIELIPKTEASETIVDKSVSRVLNKLLTELTDYNKFMDLESETKDLKALVDNLRTEYNNLDEAHINLRKNHLRMNVDYLNQINEKDLVNYALMHLLKYCDTGIGNRA
jgi:hypothetical protein